MSRILVVEDNEDLAFGLRRVLEFEGYAVEVAPTAKDALARFEAHAPELLVLDLMLPDGSGFEVLRSLRSDGSRVPVLILTARSEETDVVMGFHSGADDYVTKPFSTAELLARVRALLRRADWESDHEGRTVDRFGDVEVDRSSRTATRGGQALDLTPKEFDLLTALLDRDGAVVSRDELLRDVWMYANTAVMTRTVDVHIAELRRKLEEDPASPRHILTVRKAGYRLKR